MDYLATIWKKTDSVVARKISDEVILVPIRQTVADLDSIYTLNETSARIWELLDGRNTGTEIITVLTTEFDSSPEQMTADVENFLKQLESIQAIQPTA
jgi:hypothetical protein